MKPYYAARHARIYVGDCREVLPAIAPQLRLGRVECCVTDPPYGLEFMGKGWDHAVPGAEFWGVVRARLLPGAHVLAFGGTRTYHRLACALEDAGLELRDCLSWLYGTGFPKSLDASRAVDAHLGRERPVIGTKLGRPGYHVETTYDGGAAFGAGIGSDTRESLERKARVTGPASPEAARWAGWGTALKPAWEPILLARAPLDGTVAANLLAHGCGALAIDACRVGADGGGTPSPAAERRASGKGRGIRARDAEAAGRISNRSTPERYAEQRPGERLGRWPANVVLSHAPGCVEVGTREVRTGVAVERNKRVGTKKPGLVYEGGYGRRPGEDVTYGVGGREEVPAYDCVPGCAVAALDAQSGNIVGKRAVNRRGAASGVGLGYKADVGPPEPVVSGYDDEGGASRFFYCAKASRAERERGLEGLARVVAGPIGDDLSEGKRSTVPRANVHPTVKPLALMRWLVRLASAPEQRVLDPFCGSGSTLVACVLEGRRGLGIELEERYAEIAARRCEAAAKDPEAFA